MQKKTKDDIGLMFWIIPGILIVFMSVVVYRHFFIDNPPPMFESIADTKHRQSDEKRKIGKIVVALDGSMSMKGFATHHFGDFIKQSIGSYIREAQQKTFFRIGLNGAALIKNLPADDGYALPLVQMVEDPAWFTEQAAHLSGVVLKKGNPEQNDFWKTGADLRVIITDGVPSVKLGPGNRFDSDSTYLGQEISKRIRAGQAFGMVQVWLPYAGFYYPETPHSNEASGKTVADSLRPFRVPDNSMRSIFLLLFANNASQLKMIAEDIEQGMKKAQFDGEVRVLPMDVSQIIVRDANDLMRITKDRAITTDPLITVENAAHGMAYLSARPDTFEKTDFFINIDKISEKYSPYLCNSLLFEQKNGDVWEPATVFQNSGEDKAKNNSINCSFQKAQLPLRLYFLHDKRRNYFRQWQAYRIGLKLNFDQFMQPLTAINTDDDSSVKNIEGDICRLKKTHRCLKTLGTRQLVDGIKSELPNQVMVMAYIYLAIKE